MKPALLIAVLLGALAAQEIDRIAVVVERRPITMGDWEQQERFEAMSNREPWQGLKRSQEALDRLIDRAIILEQMQLAGIGRADIAAAAAQLTALRTQLKLESDAEWRAMLRQYGLLEADVAEVVAEQTHVLRFIEQRFRPAVHISPDEVQRYYRATYLPQFAKTARPGTAPPPLEQVQPQIVTVLAEQRMNDLFAAWLKTVRAQVNIRRLAKEARR